MKETTRKPGKHDFTVEVDGVGDFIFARRTMADELRIQAEYSRLTEGVPVPSMGLFTLASSMATLRVLAVQVPDDWDMEAMDPLEEDTFETIEKVFMTLRQKEQTFRKGGGRGSETEGQGDGGDNGVLDPSEVQPPAE